MSKPNNIATGPERRFVASPIVADTVDAEGQKVTTIEGYAALYNVRTNIGGLFDEVIAPGAFDDVLTKDVRALYNHNPSQVLARTQNGTLKIWTDDKGLKYRFNIPNRTYALDLADCIRTGDVSESSFFFDVDKKGQDWKKREDGGYLRTLKKFTNLFDVSPVTFPAYKGTSVSARSASEFENARQELEQNTEETHKDNFDEYEARHRLLILKNA